MIFTLKKIIISCVKYRMLHVKQPDVASGAPPETKSLKEVKKSILKKVILCGCFKPGCRHLLFLCCKWRSHFSICMCLHERSLHAAYSVGHFLFLLEALYCHIVSLCSVLYKSLTEDSIKVEMYKATCYCGHQAIQSQDCISTKSEKTYTL